MKKFLLLFSIVASVFFLQSCESDPTEQPQPDTETPELPPVLSLIMPYDGYEDVDTPGVNTNTLDFRNGPSYQNWFHSVTNIAAWNTYTTLRTAIPFAAFTAILEAEPVPVLDGTTWVWSTTIQIGLEPLTVEMRMDYNIWQNPTQQFLELRITEWRGATDILLLDGVTDILNVSAEWTVYDNIDTNTDPIPLMTTLSTINEAESIVEISYTDLTDDPDLGGTSIEFMINPEGTTFNRKYNIAQQNPANLIEIEWDFDLRNGRVKDAIKFNDTEWHCWDIEHLDTDC